MWPQSSKTYFKAILVLVSILLWTKATSQSISKPNVSNACFVSPTTEFNVTATVSPPLFPNGTRLILRLSNKDGGFNSNSIVVAETTVSGINVDFGNFSYPVIDGEGTTIGSDDYRVRIENSDGSINRRSDKISIFYYDGTEYLTNPSSLCEPSGTLTAMVELETYVWYRRELGSGNLPLEIKRGSENFLEVTQPGEYFYTPIFGTECTNFISELYSRPVKVFAASAVTPPDFSIEAITSTNICASESVELRLVGSLDPTFNYQWTKDGQALIGQTGTSIAVTGIDAEGDYKLQVSDDSAKLSTECSKQSNNSIFVDLKNPFATFPETQSLVVVDIPGQEEILNVDITGEDPKTITWIKDDVDIPSSNSTSFTSTGPGTYKVRVDGSSCTINTDTTENGIRVISIDNLSVVIGYDIGATYAPCAQNRLSLKIQEVSTQIGGEKVIIPPASFDSFDITWIKDGTLLSEKDSDLFIENAGGNGNYQAQISIGSVTYTSNTLNVKLNAGELQIEATSNNLNEGQTATIEVILPENAPISLYTFQWFKNGVQIEDENGKSVVVSTSGLYTAEVTFDDCPTVRLQEISVSAVSTVIPNILTPNGSNNQKWKIPQDFTGQPNVTVQIFSSTGEEVFNASNYNGEWPNGELKESIYYYIISRDNNAVKKGSITIIR